MNHPYWWTYQPFFVWHRRWETLMLNDDYFVAQAPVLGFLFQPFERNQSEVCDRCLEALHTSGTGGDDDDDDDGGGGGGGGDCGGGDTKDDVIIPHNIWLDGKSRFPRATWRLKISQTSHMKSSKYMKNSKCTICFIIFHLLHISHIITSAKWIISDVFFFEAFLTPPNNQEIKV